jgi:signal transduction histidine kinase
VSDRAAILIVDDDPVVRALMRASLEGDGFRVVEAGDGEAAHRLCLEERPDLLVVDVVMPGMDGFELCRTVRRNPDWAFLPILMATGLDDVASITKAYEAGATDFIPKPIQWLILNHRVRYMLRASQAFHELHAKREAAESASKAKTEFLANMSHELRTPLNAIIGFSQMMREGTFGALPDKYTEYAQIITDSGLHLLAIINDVLDLSRAESNRLILADERVDIATVVGFSTSIVAEMARKAEIAYSVDVAEVLPALRGDRAKLRQILINLLSNAFKFTPAGGKVSLSVVRERDGGVAFRIADTGIGITPEQMPLVLTPFGQADSRLARKYGGMGLGLPLTRRLVELHDGTLEIASRPDQGTVVTARFPPERIAGAADDGRRHGSATG